MQHQTIHFNCQQYRACRMFFILILELTQWKAMFVWIYSQTGVRKQTTSDLFSIAHLLLFFRRYGLEDLLNALLFLFYEPNFDEFLNGNVSVSENAPNMKQTIWKSLYGGFVNEIWYDPNAAWIQWVEGNGNHPFRQSSTKECFEVSKVNTLTSSLSQIICGNVSWFWNYLTHVTTAETRKSGELSI